MAQVSSSSLLLMKPKSHTNLEIELLEFSFKHLVRTTKKSTKSMQYIFSSTQSQVLFALDNRTWNSASLTLEFEDEKSEKQFFAQVMGFIKEKGWNTPEISGVNILKMSVVDTSINVSSPSTTRNKNEDTFPSSSESSSIYFQQSPLPARRKMSQGDSIISLNEKSCPAIPRAPTTKVQGTQLPPPIRAGSIVKFLPMADSQKINPKDQPVTENFKSQVTHKTPNSVDQSSFTPAKIQKVLNNVPITPIVSNVVTEKQQSVKKMAVSVPTLGVKGKAKGYKSDEDEFWDPPTQSKKDTAIASKNVSPVPPVVAQTPKESIQLKKSAKKAVIKGKAKESPKARQPKGKSVRGKKVNAEKASERAVEKEKENNIGDDNGNKQNLEEESIQQSLEHEKPDEKEKSVQNLLGGLIKPEEIAGDVNKTQNKTLNPKEALEPPGDSKKEEDEREREEYESDQPTRRGLRADRRARRLKNEEEEKKRKREEVLQEKKRKEEELKKKREERLLKRREEEELKKKREEEEDELKKKKELKKLEQKALEEKRKEEEEEALEKKRQQEALEKEKKREEALKREEQKRKQEALEKSKKDVLKKQKQEVLEKKRKQKQVLEKEEKKRLKVEKQGEDSGDMDHGDHVEELSNKPISEVVSPPVDFLAPISTNSVASVVSKVLENLGHRESDGPSIATVVSEVLATLNKPCKETQNVHETRVEQVKEEESSNEFTGVSSILKDHGTSFVAKSNDFNGTFDTPVKVAGKDSTKPMRGPVAFSTPRNIATSGKVTKTEKDSISSSSGAGLNSLKSEMAAKEKSLSFGTPLKVARILATETTTAPLKRTTKDLKGGFSSSCFVGAAPSNGIGANNSTTSGSPTLNNPRVFTTTSPWESAPDTYQAQKDRFLETVTGQRETFHELLGHLTKQVVRKMEFVEMRMLKDTEQFEEWFERTKDKMKTKEDGWLAEMARLNVVASQSAERSLASLQAWAVLQK